MNMKSLSSVFTFAFLSLALLSFPTKAVPSIAPIITLLLGADTNRTVPAEVSALATSMTVMASVTDADGIPIPGAQVGDNGKTGSDGIAMAATQPTTSGWYAVDAPGYAQEYIKPLGSHLGKRSFAVRLTPIDMLQDWSLAAATPVTLKVGGPLAPTLSVGLGPSAFNGNVTVAVTMLDPLKTHTTLAALDTTDNLYINYPFEIRAFDANATEVQMANGETANATIMDNGNMGATPRLFWFNPESGRWEEELTAGCVRLDSAHVQCSISHFSQHGGGSSTPPPPPASDPNGARRGSDEEFKGWSEGGDTSGGMPDALLDALTNELIAVIDWAKNHPSEEAKTMLVQTWGRLELLGYNSYQHKDANGVVRDTSELIDAVQGVLIKLAAPHIQNPLCSNFEKIMHLAVQALYLGFDNPGQDLLDVFNELVDQCNVIQGRIEYSVVLARDIGWPSWGPYSAKPRESGASYWTEYNDVNLAIHVNTAGDAVEVDGKIAVETDFPLVVYRKEVDDDGDCSFDTFKRYKYWGEPNKGGLDVTVHADADGGGLTYSNEVMTSAASITVQQEEFEVGWKYTSVNPPVCVATENLSSVFPRWESYQGQAMEQYKSSQYLASNEFITYSSAIGNFPTVWDILGQTPDVTRKGGENSYPTRIWRGSEILIDIYNLESGDYPHKVIMRYELQHIDYTKGGWVMYHR